MYVRYEGNVQFEHEHSDLEHRLCPWRDTSFRCSISKRNILHLSDFRRHAATPRSARPSISFLIPRIHLDLRHAHCVEMSESVLARLQSTQTCPGTQLSHMALSTAGQQSETHSPWGTAQSYNPITSRSHGFRTPAHLLPSRTPLVQDAIISTSRFDVHNRQPLRRLQVPMMTGYLARNMQLG